MSTAWIERAACLGVDPDLFYPERGDRDALTRALAVCAGCPVRQRCLDERGHEKEGVVGGLSARQRRGMRAGPPRPKPAKRTPTRERMRSLRERRFLAGLCVQCARSWDGSTKTCPDCMADRSERKRKATA